MGASLIAIIWAGLIGISRTVDFDALDFLRGWPTGNWTVSIGDRGIEWVSHDPGDSVGEIVHVGVHQVVCIDVDIIGSVGHHRSAPVVKLVYSCS